MADIYNPNLAKNRAFQTYLGQYGATSGTTPSASMLDQIVQNELSNAANKQYQQKQLQLQQQAQEQQQSQFNTNVRLQEEARDAASKAGYAQLAAQGLSTYGMLKYLSPDKAPVQSAASTAGQVVPNASLIDLAKADSTFGIGQPGYPSGTTFADYSGVTTQGGQTYTPYGLDKAAEISAPTQQAAEGTGRIAINRPSFVPSTSTESAGVGANVAGNTTFDVTTAGTGAGTGIADATTLGGGAAQTSLTAAPEFGVVGQAASELAPTTVATSGATGAGAAGAGAEAGTAQAGGSLGGSASGIAGKVMPVVAAIGLADTLRQKYGGIEKPYEERGAGEKFFSTPLHGGPSALLDKAGLGESPIGKSFTRLGEVEDVAVGQTLDKFFSGNIGGGIESLVKSPISAISTLVGGGCFVTGTKVEMADGSTKSIEDIRLFEEIKTGGKVTGRGELLTDNLYFYEGVLVSGSHAVKEDGIWKRVEDATKSILSSNDVSIVHTLNTEKHRIIIHGVTFADFAEVDGSYDMNQEERIDALNEEV